MSIREGLQNHGFRMASGLIEIIGAGSRPTIIGTGIPGTWDYNNGVTVGYDENGIAWVKKGNFILSDLKKGAHVPFSNDGGFSIRQMFPD